MTGAVIILQSKSMDWFLYYKGLRHERVKAKFNRILFLTASMDYSILKSSLSSDTQLSSLKLLHIYAGTFLGFLKSVHQMIIEFNC